MSKHIASQALIGNPVIEITSGGDIWPTEIQPFSTKAKVAANQLQRKGYVCRATIETGYYLEYEQEKRLR